MKISLVPLTNALLWLSAADALASRRNWGPSCRFALDWTQEDVVRRSEWFEWDVLYWEGKFHQNDVSYNSANGMSYDGTQLDWETGERTKKHPFSAASKEVSIDKRKVQVKNTGLCFEGIANYGICTCHCWFPKGCTLLVAE